MALQGSLDDFALPDVLSLLASTKKTGELQVTNGRGADGRVWLDGGRIVFGEALNAADLVDTLFELLRFRDGTFEFRTDSKPPSVGEARDVDPLLAEAQARLKEWRVIEAVVPSLAARASLVPDLPGAHVALEAEQWRVIVAVANGGTVDAVATALGLGEFGACKAVKQLVDAGLVHVDPDAGSASGPVDLDSLVEIPARKRRRHQVEEPHDDDPVAEPAVDAFRMLAGQSEDADGEDDDGGELRPATAHALARQLAHANLAEDGIDAELDETELVDEHGEPINRGLLLKFLSSVRS